MAAEKSDSCLSTTPSAEAAATPPIQEGSPWWHCSWRRSGDLRMARGSHNRVGMKTRRKQLRRNLTPAEAALWRSLKNSQVSGRKFRRQYSVGKYVLDFYCVEEWLAVELDGQVHKNYLAEAYDENRTIFLNRAGIKVLRFENYLVFEEREYVLHRIQSSFGWKERSTTPSAEAADTPPIQEGS